MPPKQSTSSTSKAPAKRASTSTSRATAGNKKRAPATTTRIQDDDDVPPQQSEEEEDEEERAKTIPPALLTRLLHEFFAKEGTRITKDANEAVAKYMDVFVREAIARSVAEREGGGFLEVSIAPGKGEMEMGLGAVESGVLMSAQVEDLEKVAPQLLLDM